jgi:hypothetical protein
MKPYLIIDFELMINPVFFMPRLIFGLDFLQLFLYCLMYLLNLLNEPFNFVCIIMSILFTYFSKRKFHLGDLGKYPKHTSKRIF